MDQNSLCDTWGEALARWAIPDEILAKATKSPWQLSPEMFGPISDRALTPTVSKVRQLLDGTEDVSSKSVLDVGCGAGAVSLLLLDHVVSLTGVDASQSMLDAFESGFQRANHSAVDLRLICGAWLSAFEAAGKAGVVICANVLYNVPTPCEFILRLDDAATLGVVIEIHERHPHSTANAAWKYFWGIDRPTRPTGEDLVEIVKSLGIAAQSETFVRDPEFEVDEAMVRSIRERVCLDASRDEEIRNFLVRNPPAPPRSRVIWWTK